MSQVRILSFRFKIYKFMNQPDFSQFLRQYENTIKSVVDVVRDFCPEDQAEVVVNDMIKTTETLKKKLGDNE